MDKITEGMCVKIVLIIAIVLTSVGIIMQISNYVYALENENNLGNGNTLGVSSDEYAQAKVVDEEHRGYVNEYIREEKEETTIDKLQAYEENNEYEGTVINLTDSDRKLVESVVMGETSGLTFEAAAVVAQAIRDSMVTDKLSVSQVLANFQYTTRYREPNENVRNSVKFIFDDGDYIVKHRVMYFYAPSVTRSGWHESQQFVVEYGGHRVFDRR